MIKLAILLQVTMFFDKLVILKGDYFYVDKYPCLTLTNIPEFSKN